MMATVTKRSSLIPTLAANSITPLGSEQLGGDGGLDQWFATIASVLLRDRAVTLIPKATKGFGSSALKINDKIFAMVSWKGQFVVKLPRGRVDELVASGDGERF